MFDLLQFSVFLCQRFRFFLRTLSYGVGEGGQHSGKRVFAIIKGSYILGPIIRGCPGKPNQRKADSQAGSRIWGVFVNSECFFLENQGEFTKKKKPIHELHRFLRILLVFPGTNTPNSQPHPNSRTGLRIGLSLLLVSKPLTLLRPPTP